MIEVKRTAPEKRRNFHQWRSSRQAMSRSVETIVSLTNVMCSSIIFPIGTLGNFFSNQVPNEFYFIEEYCRNFSWSPLKHFQSLFKEKTFFHNSWRRQFCSSFSVTWPSSKSVCQPQQSHRSFVRSFVRKAEKRKKCKKLFFSVLRCRRFVWSTAFWQWSAFPQTLLWCASQIM